MKDKLILALLAGCCLGGVAIKTLETSEAQAWSVPCEPMPRDVFLAHLIKFGQEKVGEGLTTTTQGHIVEQFVAPTGAWTLTFYDPGVPGLVCGLSFGTQWKWTD